MTTQALIEAAALDHMRRRSLVCGGYALREGCAALARAVIARVCAKCDSTHVERVASS